MKRLQEYDGIDLTRLVLAFLVIAAHTYPLSSISEDLNFLLVHVIARVAVPFFMMTTGYFLLPRFFDQKYQSTEPIICFIKKTGLLYIGATLLYLPVSIYAGFYSNGNILRIFIRNLLLDGTFYHLWYLPAVMLGVLLVFALSRKCSLYTTFGITIFLYLVGLLGDNYYSMTANIPFLQAAYESGFNIFSYTRNGLFYAPIFLTMGAMMEKEKQPLSKPANTVGLIISMLLMITEGMLLKYTATPRHTSMYISLLFCSYFLFGLIKNHHGKRSPFMRDTSMWIFILHPLLIVAIRGAAKITGLTSLLVANNLVFYLLVSALSLTTAILIGKRHQLTSFTVRKMQRKLQRKLH